MWLLAEELPQCCTPNIGSLVCVRVFIFVNDRLMSGC